MLRKAIFKIQMRRHHKKNDGGEKINDEKCRAKQKK